MGFLYKFFLLIIFLSIGFNFVIVEGALYLSNILSLMISILIIFNLTPNDIQKEKNQLTWLLILTFYVLLGMQSINGIKWIYLFVTFYAFSLFFRYNKFKLNHILLTYSIGLIVATLFSFQTPNLSYLGDNFSAENRLIIDQLGGFNVYSVLLAYAMIILVHLQFQYRSILFLIISSFSLILLFTAQISTLSRGGLISLLSGLVIYSFFKKTLIKSVIIFSVIISTLLFFIINNFDIDLISIFNRYTFFEDSTGSGRTVLWSNILSLMSNPFIIIFGNGAGSLDLYIPVVDGNWYSSFESTHNTYLEFFYQFGILGLFLFIYFLFKTKMYIDRVSSKDDYIILMTIFYMFLLNMFFDSYFFALQITSIYSLFFSLFRESRYAK
jgi:O-antigen ligase